MIGSSQNSDGTGWAYGTRLASVDYGDGLGLSFDPLYAGPTFYNNALFISGRSGRIGRIGMGGVTAPDYALHVAGTIYSDTEVRAPIFRDADGTGYFANFADTGTSINIAGSVNAATYNKPAILVNSSGTASSGAAFAIQQVTGEGWTGIFVDYEPYTGWGLYHDNPSNYFLITSEGSTGAIGGGITVPSRSSGNRTAYVKHRFDQNNGDLLVGGDLTVYGGDINIQKSGNYSYINFAAQSNDPGYIWHYESSNTARMFFSVSDDDGTNDYFGFGFSGDNQRLIIYSSGRLDAPIMYDRSNTSFYVDPASTSNLGELQINSQLTLSTPGAANSVGNINALWGMQKPMGYKIYWDEEFRYGSNSINIYNNNGGSAVTHTRRNSSFADGHSGPPNSSGYVIEIMHAPTTSAGTSPGYGGWYFATYTGPANRRLLCIFRMKIPSGRSVEWASNSIGSGGSARWLTSNAGTGQYQDYAFMVHSGNASWSSTHFFYIVGGSSATFYTYLASATVYDCSSLSEEGAMTYYAGESMRAPIFYDQDNTTYRVDPTGNSRMGRDIYVEGNTGGSFGNRVIVGATSTPYTLQDGNQRPTVYLRGNYPVLTLDHTVTSNTNHGPTIQFAHNGLSNRQWLVGTTGDGISMDIGFSNSSLGNSDFNPHNGIAGYLGTTFMRFRENGTIGLGSNGDWGAIGGGDPSYPLEFRGTHLNSHAALFRNNTNASNGAGFIFVSTYGNHSWGIVSEFRIDGTGGDRPSILFSQGYSGTTWSVGFGYNDDNFRIKQNHGHRNGGWGTDRFTIDTGGTGYFFGELQANQFTDRENTAYLVNPAGTNSRLNSVRLDNPNYTPYQNYINSDNAPIKTWNGALVAGSDYYGANTYTVIVTNVPQDSYMMGSFTIDWFENYGSTNAKTSIQLGGYWNAESNSGFIGWEMTTSNPYIRPQVQVARQNSTGKTAIILTHYSSNYCQIVARDLFLGYSGGDESYGRGWEIRQESSLGGYSNFDTVVLRSAPARDGDGASGTWPISITGNSNYAVYASYLNAAQDSADKADISTRTNSGFWQTSAPSSGWYPGASSWQHLLSVTHSNPGNYYAMQLAASFFSQGLWYRSTNGSGGTGWQQIVTNSGTWSINVTGNAGSAGSVAGTYVANSGGGTGYINANQIFNNMGNNHGAYTDFNSIANLGVYYVQGSGNGPGTGGGQYYGMTLGLGNEYGFQYATQIAWNRTPTGGNPYISFRFREGSSWGGWTRAYVGYADSAGSAGTTDQVTVFDTRSSVQGPQTGNRRVRFDFLQNSTDGLGDGGTYHGVMTFQQWPDSSGGGTRQLGFTDNNNLWIRGSGGGLSSYGGWKLISDSGNSVTYTGIKYHLTNNGGQAVNNSNSAILQAYSTGNNSAFMSFHKGGHYAINMGLDDDNVFRIGGWSAGANRFVMDMSGNLTMAGNVTAYSDVRLKGEIETIPNALDKVNKLRGVTFVRTDKDGPTGKQMGVIAQEIMDIVPEVVSKDNLGIYNVAYGNLAGLFIESIKELKADLDSARAEIKELKEQLSKK
jgi:hypothetical protein